MPLPETPPIPVPPRPPIVAVVVPCYRERAHVMNVLARIGSAVRHIVVVDDACPESTGDFVRQSASDARIEVIVHETNQGVGGATLTGYRRALELGADIVVKVDGDGQMDPALIPSLIAPIADGRADYTKGNRFEGFDSLAPMPYTRIVGNIALSFISKISSGYWNVFDCTNGFTAIHARVAASIVERPLNRRYFFESDMLFHLGLMRAVVADVPMKAHYGNETSSLSVGKALFEFAAKHFVNAAKRLCLRYFIADFGMASVQFLAGIALASWGVIFGVVEWHKSDATGVPATAGTVLLAGLPIILGSQLLIAFLGHDTRNVPREPIHPRLPPIEAVCRKDDADFRSSQ